MFVVAQRNAFSVCAGRKRKEDFNVIWLCTSLPMSSHSVSCVLFFYYAIYVAKTDLFVLIVVVK